MDNVFASWLAKSTRGGVELSEGSDRLDLEVLDSQHFAAQFHCRGLVGRPDGTVTEWEHFVVGIRIPDDYLRRVDSMDIVTIISPRAIFHPNAAEGHCCIGHIAPGTPLVDLLHRVYEVITWQELTPTEFDALNPAACAWARHNRHRFPVDDRPLKRRRDASPRPAVAGAVSPPEVAS